MPLLLNEEEAFHAITSSPSDKGEFTDPGVVGSGARSLGARKAGDEEIGRGRRAADLWAMAAAMSAAAAGNCRDGLGLGDGRRFGWRCRLVSSGTEPIWLGLAGGPIRRGPRRHHHARGIQRPG